MKHLLHITVGLSLVLLCSCSSSRDVERMLDKAEELMVERPDSSLVVLEGIDITTVASRGTKARYALLLTQAKDKNYIDETDATLIEDAVEYYEESDNVRYKFMSYYYQGRIYSNGGNNTKAMLSYTKAEELVSNIDDNYAVALLYAHIGMLHDEIYDYEKSLHAFQEAYHHYEQAGLETHKNYTKLSIGQTYLDTKQFELAEKPLLEVLEWAYTENDSELCESCIDYLILLYENMGDRQKLQELFDSKFMSLCDDSLIIQLSKAYIHACDGNRELANKHLMYARALVPEYNEVELFLFEEYKIHCVLGDYQEALTCHERLLKMQDSTIRITLQQPLLTVQKEYFKSQATYRALALRHSRHMQIVITIAAIFTIGIVAIIMRRRISQKNMEIQRYMEHVQDLEDSLFAKTSNSEDMDAMITEMKGHLSSLFESQFSLINKLSNTYYETHGTKRDKEAIYTQVRNEIEKLQTDKGTLAQLEKIVNQYKRNAINLVRTEIPSISPRDIKLLCYIYVGFSAKSISIFVGETTGNILTRKYRLRNKISKLNTPNAQIILEEMP